MKEICDLHNREFKIMAIKKNKKGPNGYHKAEEYYN